MKRIFMITMALMFIITTSLCALPQGVMAEDNETVVHLWDFENGISGWGDSLSSSVALTYSQETAETKALAFEFAYNSGEVGNWNNCPIFSSPTYMQTIGQSTNLKFDVYLEKGKATTGSIEIYPIIQSPDHNYWFQLPLAEISAVSGGEEISGGLMKYTLTYDLADASGNVLAPTDTIHVLTFCNCGKFTDYNGKIYYDNIRFVSLPEQPKELTAVTTLNQTSVVKGGTVSVTCNAEGGTAPYQYTFYALKDGVVEYKSDIWTDVGSAEITLNNEGTYKIMTYCRDSLGKKVSVKDNVDVYAQAILPVSITLSQTSISIEKGKTAMVTATISPENATDKTVTFTTDKNAVATVDQNGVITAVNAGTATITATTANGLTAKVNVTCTAPVVAEKYIALTFDDGPDANTGEILDTLAQYNAKATFFVLHTNAQYNTALVKRIHEEGHELGNHTKTHQYLTLLTDEEAKEEIGFVNDFIYNLTGETVKLYRPPYLAYYEKTLALFPEMSAITCSIDSLDWSGITTDEIVANVVNKAKNGDIVLLHVNIANTRAALPQILETLQEQGFGFVTVSELFEINNKPLVGGKVYSSAR